MGQLIRAVRNQPLDGDRGARCDYFQFQGRGICDGSMGCAARGEPSCITDEPPGGWPCHRNLLGRLLWVLRDEGYE